MVLFPNAKINLGLNILSKRDDGYHNIESLMTGTRFTDIMEFTESRDKSQDIKLTGLKISGAPQDNLVLKAWKLLNEEFGIPPVKILLHKIIPAGAGLGGGSSDAAYMLKGLNDYFQLGIPAIKLQKQAIQLGSDCGFFIENKTSFISGKGDIITPAPEVLKNKWLYLFYPGLYVSTADAYSLVKPRFFHKKITDVVLMNYDDWKENIINDFEVPVFKKYPLIGEIKQKLYESGAFYASMSGSGSSVFGIFHEQQSFSSFLKQWLIWGEEVT